MTNAHIARSALLAALALCAPWHAAAQAAGGGAPVEEAEEQSEGTAQGEVVEEEDEAGIQPPGPPKAAAPPFDYDAAAFTATEKLYGAQAAGGIGRCLEKWIHAVPDELTLVVEVGPSGKAAGVASKESLGPEVKGCFLEELAPVALGESPAGFKVTVRYTRAQLAGGGAAGAAAEPPPGKEFSLKPKGAGSDLDPSRAVYAPTAFTRPKGRFTFASFDIGNIVMSYGAASNIDVTIGMALPAAQLTFMVMPKFAFQLHPKVRMAVTLDFGLAWPYFMMAGDSHEGMVGFVYGGAPLVLTIGSEDRFLNISCHLQGVSGVFWHEDEIYDNGHYRTHKDVSSETHFVIFPDVGGSVKVHKNVKLNLEVWTIATPSSDFEGLSGRFWGVMYGARFFGRRIFVDLHFVYTIFPGWWQVQQYVPMGWPLVTVGFVL